MEKKLTELLIACGATWNPAYLSKALLEAGVTLNPYSKHCYQCKNFIGGGDWSLCCSKKYELCYKISNACELFDECEE